MGENSSVTDRDVDRGSKKGKEKFLGSAAMLPVDDSHYQPNSENSLGGQDKGVDYSKPDWWAQEQIANWAGYNKLQEDIQLLRNEIKAHFEPSEEMAQENKIGPDDYYDKGSPEMFIEPAGVMDFSCLCVLPYEYQGASLTLAEISMCKEKCKLEPEAEMVELNTDRTRVVEEQAYSVEFPPELEEEQQTRLCNMETEEQQHLFFPPPKIFSLKRSRGDLAGSGRGEDLLAIDYPCRLRKHRKEGGGVEWSAQGGQKQGVLLKAEEAGHAMPPPAP